MALPNRSTAEWQALDSQHHLHPFTDTAALNDRGAIVIEKAAGVYLHDTEGKRYLDGMSGLWCVNVGYGRDAIAEAASRQMRELPYANLFFQTTHQPAVELARALAEVTPPGFERAFFTSSGSEAVDTAYRMARHYWRTVGQPQRRIIIARDKAYHGSTVAGAGIGGMPAMHAQGGDVIADAVRHIPAPYWYAEGSQTDPAEFGRARAQELERTLDEVGPENVAAFIGEPVQGAGGLIIPPDSYWPEIARICRERDILLISDEVICGFGRTGHWFGCEHFGYTPDLMTVAKGLSSGYLPIGGVLVGPRVGEAIAGGGGELYHGYTYSGHPACCAAAIENLRIMREEGIVERVHSHTAAAFAERWQSLADHPLVGEVRSTGLLGGLELSPEPAARTPFPGDPGKAGLLCRERSFANGLIMRSVGDTMVVAPPLIISDAELDELVTLARQTLDDTVPVLQSEGLL